MRAYRRWHKRGEPRFYQEAETWILLGNKVHIFNTHDKEWFTVPASGVDPSGFHVPNTLMERVSILRFLAATRIRGALEVLEDITRQNWISQFIERRRDKQKRLSDYWADDTNGLPLKPPEITGGSFSEVEDGQI